jgi:hypothetical protein
MRRESFQEATRFRLGLRPRLPGACRSDRLECLVLRQKPFSAWRAAMAGLASAGPKTGKLPNLLV